MPGPGSLLIEVIGVLVIQSNFEYTVSLLTWDKGLVFLKIRINGGNF